MLSHIFSVFKTRHTRQDFSVVNILALRLLRLPILPPRMDQWLLYFTMEWKLLLLLAADSKMNFVRVKDTHNNKLPPEIY